MVEFVFTWISCWISCLLYPFALIWFVRFLFKKNKWNNLGERHYFLVFSIVGILIYIIFGTITRITKTGNSYFSFCFFYTNIFFIPLSIFSTCITWIIYLFKRVFE